MHLIDNINKFILRIRFVDQTKNCVVNSTPYWSSVMLYHVNQLYH